MVKKVIFIGVIWFFMTALGQASDKKRDSFWDINAKSEQLKLTNQAWQTFLDAYVVETKNQTYVAYKEVSNADKKSLKTWLKQQQRIDPRQLSKANYQAFWINLYNAATVDLILDHYPIKSITKLGGWFEFGPWDQTVVKINNRDLSLNDIEHSIMRARFDEPRFHYVFNCASLGCPNLSKTAFSEQNLEAQLEHSAVQFINHQRGVAISAKNLTLSKIYTWYEEDFGNQTQLLQHLKRYAAPELKEQLMRNFKRIDYDYDWSLNEDK